MLLWRILFGMLIEDLGQGILGGVPLIEAWLLWDRSTSCRGVMKRLPLVTRYGETVGVHTGEILVGGVDTLTSLFLFSFVSFLLGLASLLRYIVVVIVFRVHVVTFGWFVAFRLLWVEHFTSSLVNRTTWIYRCAILNCLLSVVIGSSIRALTVFIHWFENFVSIRKISSHVLTHSNRWFSCSKDAHTHSVGISGIKQSLLRGPLVCCRCLWRGEYVSLDQALDKVESVTLLILSNRFATFRF